MNSTEEIILSSLCDRIQAFCNRLNKKLDEYDEFPSSYTTPAISHHGQPSWPVATAVTQPRPPPDPPNVQLPYAPPYQPDRYQQPSPYQSLSYQPESYPPPPPDYYYPSNYNSFPSNITNLPPYSFPHLRDTSQIHQLYDQNQPPLDHVNSYESNLNYGGDQRTYDGRSESMDYRKEDWASDEYWNAADSRCLSPLHLHLHHVPSTRSPPTAAAIPPPPASISLSCSPDFRYDSMELIVDDNDESRESCPNTTIDRLPNRDQVAVKEVLLDVEEKDGFLQAFEVANFEYVDEAERVVDEEIPAPPSEWPRCSSLAFVLAEEIGPVHIEKYSQPAAPVVPPPPPQRSPSCWSLTSHSRSATPLPAAAAAPFLNLPLLAPPCSPDIIRVEEVLLDNEEKVGILTDSSPSRRCLKIQEFCFRARSEALECMPTGPDNWATVYISDVNALMIYCPRRPKLLGILGVHEVDASAINALATHGPVWTNIGSIDCRKLETSLGNIASPLTSWLRVVIVFIVCQKYCVFDPGGLANKGAIMGIDEGTFHLSVLELIDGVVLINQCVICASITDMCLENGSIGNVKKVYYVVEDGFVKQGGVSLCAFLGDKIAYGLPQDWMKIASLYVDLYVSDIDSINHRSTSFETDARLIPPHTDMLCLNIVGRIDELPILALHCSEPKSPSLVIFGGNNEGRCSTVRCVFDPGGDTSPKLLLLTLFVASWFPP